MKRSGLGLTAILALVALPLAASAQPADPPAAATVTLIVRILDAAGAPVLGADVEVAPAGGEPSEHRSNSRGIARFPGLPRGRARVQVVATGFDPGGKNVQLEASTLEIELRLKRTARPEAAHTGTPSPDEEPPRPR